jgi:hypothetical protein
MNVRSNRGYTYLIDNVVRKHRWRFLSHAANQRHKFLRGFIFIVLIICAITISIPAYSKDKKDIILSTVDISGEYEIIGIVYGRIGTTDIKELNKELKRRAAKIDADAVIGIRYLPYIGYLYAYGTAIKFKE